MDGCVDSSTLTTPAFNALVSAGITPSSAITFCDGNSVTFTAAAGASATHQWNKDGVAIPTATAATYTATTTGTYSVTSKGAGGCAITTPTGTFVSVGARPTAVITASGPVAFCSGDSVTLSANTGTGLTYVWEKDGSAIVPAETGASYKAKTAGSYKVRVTNANLCTDPSLATVVTLNDATTNTLTAVAPTTVCVGDSVVLNATGTVIGGGTGTVLYQWYNGATVVADSTRSNLVARTAGSYTVKTSLAGGCKTTSTVVAVTMRALPVVTPATTTTFCAGNSVALKTPRVAGATYNWTSMNGAVARVIPVGTDTSYAVTSNGVDTTSRFTYQVAQTMSGLTCTSAKTTVSLNANPVPQLKAGGVISVGALTICEFDSVGLKITDAGKAAASYSWSTPYGWTNGSTSDTLTARPGPTSPSAYTVTITNAAGCTAAVTQQLDKTTAPVNTVTLKGALTFCAGDSVVIKSTILGGAGVTYEWKNSAGTVVSTVDSLKSKVSDTYSYLITSTGAGACKNRATFVVNALPTTPASITGVAAICSGASTTLTAAPAGAGYTYQWYKDGVATAVGATYSVNAAGSYTVVATNGGLCSTAPSAATVVTVNTPAVPTITAAATSFCAGGSQVLKASTGTAYQWSFNNVAITTGGTDSTYTANAAGVYTVAVTNASGCVATSATTALTVNALPTASITAAGTTTFCTGGSVVLNANTGTGLTYKWFNNGTEVATTASYTATATGSYTVEVTNASGCKKVSDATAVNANAAGLTVAVTAVTSTTFCQGGNVVLNAPAAASYQWSKNGAIIPGATSGTYVANATGSYSVAVADANSCAGTSAGTAVTVNALPTATITAFGNTTLCEGDNVTLNVSGGTSYAWSTGSTSTSVVASTAGAYSVTVTDANGCTAAATQAVSVNALPVATSTAAGATTFCAGGSVNLNANTGTGLTYQWMNGANAVAGATAATHAATTAGSYTVVVTSTNGCRNTSNATVVTVSAAPVPALTTSRSPNLCPGDNVTLTATGGDTYSWSTGVTTAAITTSAAGTYTVTVTNAAGCTATASQAVVVNAAPLATLTAGGLTSFCPGDNVALSAPVGVNYGYQWLNNGAVISGSMHRVHAANVAGSYTAVVTDTVTGCSSTSSTPIVVTIYARPTVSFTNAVQTGTGSVVDFTNTSTAGTPTWSFGDAANSSSMQQNPTFWYKTNGTYNVTLKVTSANGCVDSLTKTVTVTGARTDLSELQETLQAVAYPNPFTNRFVIEIQNPNVVFGANDRLVVTNTLGQLVHQTVLNQKMTEISTEEWAAGIYNLTIYSNGTVIPMKKVVKMDR
jgi:PKD repeat protein